MNLIRPDTSLNRILFPSPAGIRINLVLLYLHEAFFILTKCEFEYIPYGKKRSKGGGVEFIFGIKQ